MVVVFRLTDGSEKAIAAGYLGVSTAPNAWDYGPCLGFDQPQSCQPN